MLSDESSNMMPQDSGYQIDDNTMHPTYSGDAEFQIGDATLQSANTGPIGKLFLISVKGHAREIVTIGIVLWHFYQLLFIYIFQKLYPKTQILRSIGAQRRDHMSQGAAGATAF